ncbi:MAG: PAS domain-containing protein [Candidatus Heimdallarchaeota archaeon]|nr:PAS domain-containing protein [Candidatus Heimdallarchaeota archaeon]
MPNRINPSNKLEDFNKNSSINIKDIYDDIEIIHWAQTYENLIDFRITLVDSNFEVIYTTENSERVIGYTQDDFKLLATFGYVHPDDRIKVKETFQTLDQDGYSESIMYRIFMINGTQRWIRGKAQQFLDEKTGKRIGTIIIEFDVTPELKQIENLDLPEDSFFKSLLELMKTPALFIMNNNIIWATINWQKYFGYSLHEVKNKSTELIFSSKDDYANFLLIAGKDLKKDGVLYFQTILQRKNKEKIKSEILAYPVDQKNLSRGILVFFIDFSVLTSKFKKPNDDKELYDKIINNFEEVILGVKNDHITFANNAVKKYLLYEPSELIGQNLSVLFQTKDVYNNFLSDINKAFLKNNNYKNELIINRKDRLPLAIYAKASPISFTERNGYALLIEPIGYMRQLINTLRDEKSELEFYSDQLFHDVKDLCQNAFSQIDLSIMKLESSPNDIAYAIERQSQSKIVISRIAELITNMDKFFTVRRKGYEFGQLDLFQAIETTKKKIISKFDRRKITINYNLKPQKFNIFGNELIEDVFINILENSLMYNRKQDITIDIKIHDSTEYNDYWRIEFIYENPEIAFEMKKFMNVGYAKDSHSISGSGFGLTLVKAIIESMNGYLTIEANPNSVQKIGSLIIFDIPKYHDY